LQNSIRLTLCATSTRFECGNGEQVDDKEEEEEETNERVQSDKRQKFKQNERVPMTPSFGLLLYGCPRDASRTGSGGGKETETEKRARAMTSTSTAASG